MYKKTASMLLLVIIAIAGIQTALASLGDLNGDGSVNIIDAMFIAQYTAGTRQINTNLGDVDGNHDVNINDALYIAQYTVGTKQLFDNIDNLHLNTTDISSETCKECHDVTTETSLNTSFDTPHVVHLSSDLLKFECNTCHTQINLQLDNIELSDTGVLKKQTDPETCAKCHSDFPAPPMQESYKDLDCMTCHSNWKDRMNTSFVNKNIQIDNIDENSTTCLKCHGGNHTAWYLRR